MSRLGKVNPELRSESNHAFAKKITRAPKTEDDAMEQVEKLPASPKTPNVENGETLHTEKVKAFLDAPHIGGNSIGIQRPNIFL